MIGAWRTPDGKIHIVDDSVIEHIEHAYENGWLDEWLEEDPMPEEGDDIESINDDPYYAWLDRMKQRLFDKGYVRSRLFSPRDGGDLSIQGNADQLTRPVVLALLKEHNLDKMSPITLETGDDSVILNRGTYMDLPSDDNCKDVYFPQHLIDGVQKKYG